MLGGRRAQREASPEHPFGYGRERYFWAFAVAMVLFSMGGLFALMYAGVHTEAPIQNLVTAATPVDTDGMGLFKKWSDPRYQDVDRLVDSMGNIPPELMRRSFEIVRPTDRWFSYVRLIDRLWDPMFVYGYRVMYKWTNEQIPFPGETFRQYTRDLMWENKLMRGNRTSKFNAENFNAFLSGNYPPLAEVGVHIRYNTEMIIKPGNDKLKVNKELDNSVIILKLFPGIAENVVKNALSIVALKGVILETYGAGNAPTDAWFIDALTQAIEKGIIIYNVTQCKGGAVDMGKYETSMQLGQIGVIGGSDIHTETAIAKKMYPRGYSSLGEFM